MHDGGVNGDVVAPVLTPGPLSPLPFPVHRERHPLPPLPTLFAGSRIVPAFRSREGVRHRVRLHSFLLFFLGGEGHSRCGGNIKKLGRTKTGQTTRTNSFQFFATMEIPPHYCKMAISFQQCNRDQFPSVRVLFNCMRTDDLQFLIFCGWALACARRGQAHAFCCCRNRVPLLSHRPLSLVARRLRHRLPSTHSLTPALIDCDCDCRSGSWTRQGSHYPCDGVFDIAALSLSFVSPLVFAINTLPPPAVAVPPAAAAVPLHLPSPSSPGCGSFF